MDTQNFPCSSVKRRQTNSSPDLKREKVNLPRKTGDISDDTWLEALKFMSYLHWSRKCFVSRQVNGIGQRNILRLPKMVLDSATTYYDCSGYNNQLKDLPFNEHTVIVFDTIMQEMQSTQWFKNRGFTLNVPVDIPAESALIDALEWTPDRNLNICILGTAQEKIPLSEEEKHFPWFLDQSGTIFDQPFKKPVMYYAQFNPILNRYSWNYLAQFLKCIYHPTSYIKEVNMYAVNYDYMGSLRCNIDNEPRYINCESFMLRGALGTKPLRLLLPDFLEWLPRNVRAETINISWYLCNETFAVFANFVFDPSGAKQCASKKIKANMGDPVVFLKTLIQKFNSISMVESAIPTIEFWHPIGYPYLFEHLGPNLIAQEVDSEGAGALYMISNGQNRMRIPLRWYEDCSICNVRIYSV